MCFHPFFAVMSLLNVFQDIKSTHAEACIWECEILFNMADAKKEPDYVNLCDFLTEPENLRDRIIPKGEDPNKFVFPYKSVFMFPKERFYGLEARDKLVTELKLAALKAGFKLVTRNSKAETSKSRAWTVQLKCQKNVMSTSKKEDKGDAKYNHLTDLLPWKEEDRCSFGMNVFMTPPTFFENPHCWFLATRDTNDSSLSCSTHTNHHQFPPSELHASISLLNEEERKLAWDCAQLHMTNTTQAALLTLRNKDDIQWHDSQLRYFKKKTQRLLDEEAGHITSDASSAERLLDRLEQRQVVF